jgi:hypothetical protein
MTWFGNTRLKATIIREQQQALTISIQSTRNAVFRKREVIAQALPPPLRRELRDNTIGFVKCDERHGVKRGAKSQSPAALAA